MNIEGILTSVVSSNNTCDSENTKCTMSGIRKRSRRGKRMGKRHGISVKKISCLLPETIPVEIVTTTLCSFCGSQIIATRQPLGHKLCQRCQRLFPEQVQTGNLLDYEFSNASMYSCSTPFIGGCLFPVDSTPSELALDLFNINRDSLNSTGSEGSANMTPYTSACIDNGQTTCDNTETFDSFIKQNFEEDYKRCLEDHLTELPKESLISSITDMIRTVDSLHVSVESCNRQDLLRQLECLRSENKRLKHEKRSLIVS